MAVLGATLLKKTLRARVWRSLVCSATASAFALTQLEMLRLCTKKWPSGALWTRSTDSRSVLVFERWRVPEVLPLPLQAAHTSKYLVGKLFNLEVQKKSSSD